MLPRSLLVAVALPASIAASSPSGRGAPADSSTSDSLRARVRKELKAQVLLACFPWHNACRDDGPCDAPSICSLTGDFDGDGAADELVPVRAEKCRKPTKESDGCDYGLVVLFANGKVAGFGAGLPGKWLRARDELREVNVARMETPRSLDELDFLVVQPRVTLHGEVCIEDPRRTLVDVYDVELDGAATARPEPRAPPPQCRPAVHALACPPGLLGDGILMAGANSTGELLYLTRQGWEILFTPL